MLDNYLLYRDYYVSCFFDEEKLLTIYVNNKGKCEVLNVDSNFYSIEDDIIAYEHLLFDCLSLNGEIKEIEQEEYNKHLKAFVEDISKDYDDELNFEYLEHSGVRL